jgi:hypothetical protein
VERGLFVLLSLYVVGYFALSKLHRPSSPAPDHPMLRTFRSQYVCTIFWPATWVESKVRGEQIWLGELIPGPSADRFKQHSQLKPRRDRTKTPVPIAKNRDSNATTTPMTDKPDGIELLADFLDDFARFTDGPFMFPLVILMFATIWIVCGCYSFLWPEKMIEVNRRMRWLGSVPLRAIRRADGQPRGADPKRPRTFCNRSTQTVTSIISPR